MLELLRAASLVAATMTVGLTAGLLYAFSHTIMPGLGRSDNRTFVGGFQAIDKAISNAWFGFGFLGALVFTAVAAALHLGAGERSVLPWIVAALILYVVTIVITFAFNIPLNNEIQAAGPPDQIADLAAVRERFEGIWVRWNTFRAVVCTAGFGCLSWALVLYGRL